VCGGCAASAVIHPVNGHGLQRFVDAHHHPTGIIVVRLVRLLPDAQAAA
jgi:hypothetical protein